MSNFWSSWKVCQTSFNIEDERTLNPSSIGVNEGDFVSMETHDPQPYSSLTVSNTFEEDSNRPRSQDIQDECSSSLQEINESNESSAEPKSAEIQVECTYDDTSIKQGGGNWAQSSIEVQPFKITDLCGKENKDRLPYKEALPKVVTQAQPPEISVFKVEIEDSQDPCQTRREDKQNEAIGVLIMEY